MLYTHSLIYTAAPDWLRCPRPGEPVGEHTGYLTPFEAELSAGTAAGCGSGRVASDCHVAVLRNRFVPDSCRVQSLFP